MGAGISAGTAAMIAGGVGAAGSLGGALISSSGSKQAASTNQSAQQWQEASADPYVGWGDVAGNIMNANLTTGGFGSTPSLNSSDISQMPGYKFTKQQGLLATQNAAAAQGLGVSGNALAAASQYATGLASQNYQQYFNDYWANQNNRYNQLMGVMQLGANTAVGAGSNVASTAAATGQAQANAANALGSGISGASSSAGNAVLTNALLANQTGTTIPPSSATAAQGASELPSAGFLGVQY